jgi:pimeloyl-ACP methyl ester carboxylesterase
MMKSSYFYINGIRIHYLRPKQDNEGRPVVLLHGLGANARYWEKVVSHLSEIGFSPLAPDLRGHGLTDKSTDDYGLFPLLKDLAAMVDFAQLDKPLLVGHGWGACLAMEYAARFSGGPRQPSGLITVEGIPGRLQKLNPATLIWVQTRFSLAHLGGTALDTFLKQVDSPKSGWSPDERAVQAILANYEIGEDEILKSRLDKSQQEQMITELSGFDVLEQLKRIECPVLAVYAEPPKPWRAEEVEWLAFVDKETALAQEMKPSLQIAWIHECQPTVPLHCPETLVRLIVDFSQHLL